MTDSLNETQSIRLFHQNIELGAMLGQESFQNKLLDSKNNKNF